MNNLGIQTKLIGVLMIPLMSIVAIILVVIISLSRINANFKIINQTQQRTQVIGQALLALQDASSSLGFSLGSDSNDIIKVRNFEAQFNNSVSDLNMFLHALISGSESEEFKGIEGGSLYDQWKSRKYSDQFNLETPSDQSRASLSAIDDTSHQFVDQAKASFILKKELLILESEGVLISPEKELELTTLNDQIQKHKESLSNSVNALVEENNNITVDATNEYNKTISSLYAIILVVSFVAVILMLVVGFYASYYFVSRPIKLLTDVATSISRGQLDAKIDSKVLDSEDEIGILAKAFDRTMVSLKLAMKFNAEKQNKTEMPIDNSEGQA